MARGSVDSIRRNDIASYSYGSVRHISANGSGAQGWIAPVDLSGKGIVHGGYYNSDQVNSYLRITLDDVVIVLPDFDTLNNLNIIRPEQSFVFLTKYDNNGSYTLGLRSGVTFERIYKVEIYLPVTFTVFDYSLLYSVV